MTFWFVQIAIMYLLFGVALQPLAVSDVRMRARVVSVLVWPWLLYVDGTPSIRPFLRWARGEIVIEQSEWPPGTWQLTVQRRDGSEYQDTAP